MKFNRKLLMVSLLVFLLCCPSFAADIDCTEQTECEEYDPCRCDLATPVVIEGPETVSEGSSFIVSGGRPKYRFSMSPGQINADTGVVTEITGCGTATVMVQDNCGQTDSIEVRLPNGRWVWEGGYYEEFTYRAETVIKDDGTCGTKKILSDRELNAVCGIGSPPPGNVVKNVEYHQCEVYGNYVTAHSYDIYLCKKLYVWRCP